MSSSTQEREVTLLSNVVFGGFFERILRVESILREFLTSAFHSKRQVGSLAEDKEVTERKGEASLCKPAGSWSPRSCSQVLNISLAHRGKIRGCDCRALKDLTYPVPLNFFSCFIFFQTQKTWMGVEGGWRNQALSLQEKVRA